MVPHAQAMAEQLCKTFFQYASEVRHSLIPIYLSIDVANLLFLS